MVSRSGLLVARLEGASSRRVGAASVAMCAPRRLLRPRSTALPATAGIGASLARGLSAVNPPRYLGRYRQQSPVTKGLHGVVTLDTTSRADYESAASPSDRMRRPE